MWVYCGKIYSRYLSGIFNDPILSCVKTGRFPEHSSVAAVKHLPHKDAVHPHLPAQPIPDMDKAALPGPWIVPESLIDTAAGFPVVGRRSYPVLFQQRHQLSLRSAVKYLQHSLFYIK